jgi:type VI secretion system FHA domain protein
MQLILDIVKNGKNRAEQKSFRFDRTGGIIGRNSELEYRLTDPQNYISGKHARIEYKHGRYYLWDESTNGTFLKHPYRKLPKGVPHPIGASEVFIIGDHELQARFGGDEYTDDYIVGASLMEEPEPLEAIEELIPDDDFLYEEPEAAEPVEPEESSRPPKEDVLDLLDDPNDVSAMMHADGEEAEGETPEPGEYARFEEHFEVPAAAEPEVPERTVRHGHDGGLADSLRVLEAKLDLEIVSLEPKVRDALMGELADIVVNSLDGLRNTLYIKDKTKQDLRLPALSTEAQERNPVKLGKSASQLLQNSAVGDRLGMIRLSAAVRQSFAELDAHTVALHGASKNLMGIAASGFAPKNLEHKFESTGALRGLMPRSCKIWKAYRSMFDRLNEEPESGVEMLAPRFTKEYEKMAFSAGLASVDAVQKR